MDRRYLNPRVRANAVKFTFLEVDPKYDFTCLRVELYGFPIGCYFFIYILSNRLAFITHYLKKLVLLNTSQLVGFFNLH